MQLSGKRFVKYGIFAAAAIVAYLAVGALVHADASPVITTTIRDSSDSVITSALVGANVHSVVHVASSTNSTAPQGNVDFQVYGNTSCTGSPITQDNISLVNGFATSSASVVGAAGLSYKVHYDGNADNIAADGACVSLTATSNTAAITTSLSASSIAAGSNAHDSATLNNATSNAGGTVTYTVYSDSGCQTPFAGGGNATVTNGSVANSNDVPFSTPGTYYWQAVYHGDANNSIATSTCGTEVLTVQAISKNSPSITTTLSTTTTVLTGSTIHDSATLTGKTDDAGGTVTYKIYTDNLCNTFYGSAASGVVTNGSVANSGDFTFNTPGTYYWQAVYGGDTHNNAATSTCTSEVLTVNAIPGATKTNPSISTTLSTTTAILTGNSVYDSATLSGATGNAGGTVTYKVFTNGSCATLFANAGTKTVTSGSVPNSDSVLFSTAGTYYWQAVYSGDTGNNIATSSCGNEILTVQTSGTPAPTGPGTISGMVFNDLDKDGVKDSGETGLAGFTINLYQGANFSGDYDPVFKSVVTDSNGNYSFTSLADGTYSVEQLHKTGWKQNSEDFSSVVISGGAGKGGLDFANVTKKNDNGKDNGKHKKDCTDDNENDDNDHQSSSTRGWFNFEGNQGLHLGWLKGKGNKHGKDD